MTNSTSFLIVRFGIGIMSAGFVPCQSWNPLVWSPSEVGFVNGMSAGIGNFGAGVAAYCGTTIGEATSWRTALGITLVLTFLIMIALVFAPTPPKPQPKQQSADTPSGWESFKLATSYYSTWILMLNYATCFGVELYVYNNLGDYLQEKFDVSNSEAQFLVFNIWLHEPWSPSFGWICFRPLPKKIRSSRSSIHDWNFSLRIYCLRFIRTCNVLSRWFRFLLYDCGRFHIRLRSLRWRGHHF